MDSTAAPKNGNGSRAAVSVKADIDYDRLATAMRKSRRMLEFFRRMRREAVKEYVGRRWSATGADAEVPINLIAKFVQIISRSLVAKDPRVMLSTMSSAETAAVSGMEEWLNPHLEKTYFAEKARRFVSDALYCVGIMKVALGSPASEADDYANLSGVPFAETISIDDFVFDPGCTSLEKASFAGHRFTMPLEEAKSLGYFDAKARKLLMARESANYNEDGDERLASLTRGSDSSSDDDFEEMVVLWEVWIRRENKVVTLVATPGGGVPSGDARPLKVQDWLGPECGPYHYLGLGLVPDNPMPKAPVMDLLPLHELVNRLYVKLGQQAERQKEVLPVRGGQMDDAGRLVDTADGYPMPCDNADNISPVSYGGPSQLNLQFAIHARDTFNNQAGNLDLLAGAAPQSKTASQDKMLNENASAGVSDMQEMTVAAISKILRAYSWYLWYHPELVMESTREAPGAPDVTVRRRVLPGANGRQADGKNRRTGPFENLNLRVDPYSLQHKSPQQRLSVIDQTVKDLMPMMQMLSTQGVNFDAQAYLKIRAKYSDEPDLLKIFTIGEPVVPSESTGAGQTRMPSETSREYVRRSVGQDTEASRMSDMQNSMSAEAASVNTGEQS